ncbi:MAG: tyrosine-type recombinase/integrase [Deltaproteobacteria bacterium]|nr:tyrosine-type recombinase/integrase [Deltaproteobacteria bacterium]
MGKLHDQMKEDLLLKAYSPHTQRAYLGCARHFARHYMRSPQEMGEQEVRDFLLHLLRDRNASPATQDMYVSALKFLYVVTLKRPEVVKDLSHPKRPKTLPVILSPEVVLRVFAAIRSVKYKAIIAAAYAAGLRISEVCSLSVSDIDSQRMRIHIRSGKGKKDRYVMLGESLLVLLRQYYQAVRPQGEYLFPGQKPQSHISTTAVSSVLRKVIRETSLAKKVSMHTFRHCFATHLMEAGTDIRILQVLLGHSSIRTTLRYTHITDRLVQKLVSPLDMIYPAP